MLSKAIRLGNDAGRWAGKMISVRGIEGVRVLQGFLSLARKHPVNVINRASRAALEANCFRLRPLRQLCESYSEAQSELSLDEDHPIIRPLSEYQELLSKPQVKFRINEEVDI